jgi:hypothetical protein
MYFVSAGATGEEDEPTPRPVRGPLDRTVDVRVRRRCETIHTRASKRTFIQTRYGVYSLEPVEK